MGETWNRFMMINLTREQRARIIRQDARHETEFVKQCTEDALASDALDRPKDFDKEDLDFSF
jgi:hypothetical protein